MNNQQTYLGRKLGWGQMMQNRFIEAKDSFKACVYSKSLSKRSFKRGFGHCDKRGTYIYVLDCIGCKWFKSCDLHIRMGMKKMVS